MAAQGAEELNDKLENKNSNSRMLFYKKPIKKDNYKLDIDEEECPQDVRRRELLAYQKRNRSNAFNAGRDIVDAALNSDNEGQEEMEIEKRHYRNKRKYSKYANKLMMSEWMLEVPEDYLEKWLLVACPKGQRTILVACKGITEAYSRRGYKLGRFQSALPGGNFKEHRNRCTILDCIWIKEEKTYYALDVLAWSNTQILSCEAEFRLFWLASQLQDIKELGSKDDPRNKFPILPLPCVPCNEDLHEFVIKAYSIPPLDGFLFFHREGQYTNSTTPLVTWLKPFMLEEVLGISDFSDFCDKPLGYIDYRHYIATSKYEAKSELPENEMEVANIEA